MIKNPPRESRYINSCLRKVSGEVVEDKVTLLGTSLSVASQSFGNASNTDPPGTPFPHAGLMGFFAPGSTLGANVSNWFTNICAEKQIRECRFGLAFETDNTGVHYFGGVEDSRFDGALSVAPIVSQWELFGDLAVNGKVITQDVEIATDSGTTIIIGRVAISHLLRHG
jgi:pepsin A